MFARLFLGWGFLPTLGASECRFLGDCRFWWVSGKLLRDGDRWRWRVDFLMSFSRLVRSFDH